jgi:DNA-binding SARP family transcriptional activator
MLWSGDREAIMEHGTDRTDAGRLRVRLFGDPEVRSDSGLVEAFASPRLVSMLAFLVVHREVAVARRRLAFLFWPDSSEPQARSNLRQALYSIRHALGVGDLFLRLDGQLVQWRSDAPADVDVVDFERLLAPADGSVSEAALVQAVSMYAGDLLAGVYDEWVETERARLRRSYVDALHALVGLAEARMDLRAGVHWGGCLLRADPLDESAHRGLMDVYHRLGDRARAVHVYDACVSTFDRVLGVTPGADTVALYGRIVADTERTSSVEGHHAGSMSVMPSPSLVGRAAEWSELLDCWHSVTSGRTRFVIVRGEPGIGKTYLAEAFRSWCARQDVIAVTASAFEAEGDLPYGPLVEVLRSDGIRGGLGKLDEPWLSELTRLLPELGMANRSRRVVSADEPGAKRRLFEAMCRGVVASAQPVLVVIDDLQWCDPETLEFVHFLIRFAAQTGAPLLVIGTSRDEGLTPAHPVNLLLAGLRAIDVVVELVLAPLSSGAATELAVGLFGRTALVDQVVEHAEGNPLFLVEMARAGMSGSRVGGQLPERMRAVILQRLARLPASADQVAAIGAMIGRPFTVELVAEVAQCADPISGSTRWPASMSCGGVGSSVSWATPRSISVTARCATWPTTRLRRPDGPSSTGRSPSRWNVSTGTPRTRRRRRSRFTMTGRAQTSSQSPPTGARSTSPGVSTHTRTSSDLPGGPWNWSNGARPRPTATNPS